MIISTAKGILARHATYREEIEHADLRALRRKFVCRLLDITELSFGYRNVRNLYIAVGWKFASVVDEDGFVSWIYAGISSDESDAVDHLLQETAKVIQKSQPYKLLIARLKKTRKASSLIQKNLLTDDYRSLLSESQLADPEMIAAELDGLSRKLNQFAQLSRHVSRLRKNGRPPLTSLTEYVGSLIEAFETVTGLPFTAYRFGERSTAAEQKYTPLTAGHAFIECMVEYVNELAKRHGATESYRSANIVTAAEAARKARRKKSKNLSKRS